MNEPILHTQRLILRPFALTDAPDIERLAGAREIADGTLTIPHPYEPGMAETWIMAHREDFVRSGSIVLAITTRDEGTVCGSIGLHAILQHQRAELGYWLGVPFWNRGYVTEAAREVMSFGFRHMGLHRIYAMHFLNNPASGRVMKKLGMRYEGRLRHHVVKWGEYRDVDVYGILADEWAS